MNKHLLKSSSPSLQYMYEHSIPNIGTTKYPTDKDRLTVLSNVHIF